VRLSFLIHVDDPRQLAALERLFARAGIAAFVEDESLHVLLSLEQADGVQHAHEELRFAVRTVLAEKHFEIEPLCTAADGAAP
jgi:hypothetical protein